MLGTLDRTLSFCRVVASGSRDDDRGSPTYGYADDHDVDAVADANVVTSHVHRSVLHAPCLDLDYPAALTLSPTGAPTLWVEGLGHRDWRRALASLHEAGLATRVHLTATRPALVRAELAHRYRRETDALDGDLIAETMSVAGPTASGSFARLTSSVLAALHSPKHPTGLPVTRPAALTSPWPFPLRVPAMLLPSTTNHHLYLEHEMSWETYQPLLEQLAGAKLIETGYAGASIERVCTRVRLPWIKKPAPVPVANPWV